MPKIVLHDADIEAAVDQSVTAGMPEHMSMNRQTEKLRSIAKTLDEHVETHRLHGRATLAREDEVARRDLLPLQLPESPQNVTAYRMCRGLARLHATDVHCRPVEINLAPFEIAKLLSSKAVLVADEEHGVIAVTMPVTFGRL